MEIEAKSSALLEEMVRLKKCRSIRRGWNEFNVHGY